MLYKTQIEQNQISRSKFYLKNTMRSTWYSSIAKVEETHVDNEQFEATETPSHFEITKRRGGTPAVSCRYYLLG